MDAEMYRDIAGLARELCAGQGAELLYLTIFGSALYGTDIPGRSDVDVRGVFQPSLASLALGEIPSSLHFSTSDSSRRNSRLDVDIDLWPVQRWLLRLLPAGDTGGIDLLFSPSSPACVLFRDSRLDGVFAHPLRFLDTRSSEACAEYCLKQARKYGIRGSRPGALRTVVRRARELCPSSREHERLRMFLAELAAACPDGRFCRRETVRGEDSLLLCGRLYLGGISMAEFFRRADVDLVRFGQRVLEAEKNEGLDWKALSHAVRAIRQSEELLRTGAIRFPLACREELLSVKRGERTWAELEAVIVDGLAELDILRKSSPFASAPEPDAARLSLLRCYGLEQTGANAKADGERGD